MINEHSKCYVRTLFYRVSGTEQTQGSITKQSMVGDNRRLALPSVPSFPSKIKVNVDILSEWWVAGVHAATRTVRNCAEQKAIVRTTTATKDT